LTDRRREPDSDFRYGLRGPISKGMPRSLLFTNHLQVLTVLADRPDLRLRDIARDVGITERAAHRIVGELVEEGYLTRTRNGTRNHYQLGPRATQSGTANAERLPGSVMQLFGARPQAAPGEPTGSSLGSPDPACAIFGVAIAAAPAGIAVGDRHGRLIAVNPAFCRILGRPESEIVGRSLSYFTHAADLPGDEVALGQLLSGGRADYLREKRLAASDGTHRWVEVRAAPAAHPETGERIFVATVTDISERKRQAQALEEAEERFRSAFDNAPIGMALVAPNRRWLKVNRSLCELTGYSETALLVHSFQHITHPEDQELDVELVNDVLAGKRRSFQLEKRYIHAQGDVIWVLASISLVRDAAGEPLYFVSQIEDITERKLRERALRKLAATAVTATTAASATSGADAPLVAAA